MDFDLSIVLVKQAREDAAAIFRHFMGDPNPGMSTSHVMRWFEDGKLILNVAGEKRGRWHNFSSGEHGDVSDFIQTKLSLSWGQTVAWLGRWFGADVRSLPGAVGAFRAKEDYPVGPPKRQTREFGLELFFSAPSRFEGTPGHRYLQKRLCGLVPDEVAHGGALRFASGHRTMLGKQLPGCIGAMLALMTDAKTGEPTGCHRTFINSDLNRIDRGMLGNWGVARLFPDEAISNGLSIGEGIESSISGFVLMGAPPIWAGLDAGGLGKIPVLGGIEALTIFSDNDETKTGQTKAGETFRRWRDGGAEVTLHIPKTGASDFNQMLSALVEEEAAA